MVLLLLLEQQTPAARVAVGRNNCVVGAAGDAMMRGAGESASGESSSSRCHRVMPTGLVHSGRSVNTAVCCACSCIVVVVK